MSQLVPHVRLGEAHMPVLPRHSHTRAASVRHRHPKALTVVTRVQMVGVGFRCLHHHSSFPVRLEVFSKRVSKRDSHMLISLPFILVAHLQLLVKRRHRWRISSQAKVRMNQATAVQVCRDCSGVIYLPELLRRRLRPSQIQICQLPPLSK